MTRTKRSSSGPVKEPLASSSPPTRSITTKARQSGGGRGGNKRPMKPESPEDATRVAPTARVLPSNGSSGATHPTDLLSDFPRSYSYPPLLGTVEVGGGAGGENTQLTTQSQPPSPAMMSPPTNTRTGLSTPRRLESPIAHSLANLPLTSQANTATGGDALGSSTNHNNKPPIHPRTGPSQTTQAGQTEVTQLDSILISSALSTTHPTLHNSSTSSNTAGVSPVSRSKDATTAAAPPTRASSMGVAGKSSGTVGSSGAMKGRTPSLVRGDSSLISGDNNLTNTRDSGSDGGGTHLNSPQPPSSLNRRTSSTRRGHNNSGLDLSRSTTTTRRGVESGCTTPLSGESCTTGQQLNASVNSRSATRSSRGVRVNLAQKALIGRGSYGVVFKAMSRETNQLIAVKEIDLHRATQTSMSHSTSCTQMPNHQAPPLPSSGASNVSSVGRTDSVFQERLQRVRRELSVLRQLDHPNIVRCLGEECDGQFLRIYMEYVPGGSVTQLISTFSPLQEIQASIFAKQVLHGLAYLHARHIIHRDLKGDNLLVDTNGRLKLADFGTAKDISTIVAAANIANGSESRTSGSENGVVGTANFLAPEVVDGKLEAGPAVDIWALGCCVVEMLTGKAPLAHLGNPYRVMLYIAEHPHHLVEEYIPVGNTWSASVTDFIRRCLQTDPAQRPSAVELLKHPWITDPPSDDSIGLDTADGDLSLANASIGIMANVSDEMMADSEAASAPFQEALPPPTITITREAGTSGIGDDGTTMEREGSPSAVLISENSGSLQPRKNTSRRDRRHPRRRTRNVVGDAFTQELSHLDDIQRVRKLAAELLEESGSTQGSVEISPIGRRLIGSLAQQRQQQQQQQHGGSGGIPSPAMSPLEPITSSPRHALTLLDLPANLHRGSYQPSPTKTPVRSPFLPSLGQWGTGGLAEGGVGLLGSRQGPSPTSTSPRSQGIHDCPSSNFGFTCSESKLDGDPLNHNVCSPSDSPGSTRRPSKRRSYLLTELPPSEELMIAPKSSGLVDLGTSSHRRSDGVVASPSPSKKKGKKKKSMDS